MSESYSAAAGGPSIRRGCGGLTKKPWSVVEIGAVVGGFVVFWPLGILALALKFTKGEVWPGASDFSGPWKGSVAGWKKPEPFGFKGNWGNSHGPVSSGNSAFDAYRKEQLERLEQERRKLEDERKHFAAYLERLRQAKDKDEFDRFMSERNAEPPKTE